MIESYVALALALVSAVFAGLLNIQKIRAQARIDEIKATAEAQLSLVHANTTSSVTHGIQISTLQRQHDECVQRHDECLRQNAALELRLSKIEKKVNGA